MGGELNEKIAGLAAGAAIVAGCYGVAANFKDAPRDGWGLVFLCGASALAGGRALLLRSKLFGGEPTETTAILQKFFVWLLAAGAILTPVCMILAIRGVGQTAGPDIRPVGAALGVTLVSAILLRMPVFKKAFLSTGQKNIATRIANRDMGVGVAVAIVGVGVVGFLLHPFSSTARSRSQAIELDAAAYALNDLIFGIIILGGLFWIVRRWRAGRGAPTQD